MSQHSLKNAHFASFLRAIWSVAGHAKGLRGQSAREKSRLSPNPRVGLLQLSRVRSVRGQLFRRLEPLVTCVSGLQSRLPHKEWRDRIHAKRKGRGKSQYYSATCPICNVSYDMDILGTDASARALAVEKVVSHIKSVHADALSDGPT
jgi:hypothetical protein